MCSLRDLLVSIWAEVTEIRKFNKKDARLLGKAGSITQDVSEIRSLIQHLPNKNNLGNNVRPNRGNKATQDLIQAQNLIQNNAQQEGREIERQGAGLQQN